ncbi:MAG: aminoglycoside N(3)-acetyltransferase [Halobacteriaceae archaeon]
MTESLPEDLSPEPVTVDSMISDFRDLGIEGGETYLVHSSLSSLGWVCGGAPAVIDALKQVIGENGTLVMPTHSPGNMDPANMEHPPVPESWYDTIREQMPPYRPTLTPTSGMGAIAECFRSYPNVYRSDHPQLSFAAWGADADFVTEDHTLDYSLGENSPLARVYDLDGDILFLGTSHATNTSLHLAEYRSSLKFATVTRGSAILIDGEREWVHWEDIDFTDEDFSQCGESFESEHHDAINKDTVGVSDAKLFSQRKLVDFAIGWFENNRE